MIASELLNNCIGKILIVDKSKNLYMKIDTVEVIKRNFPDGDKNLYINIELLKIGFSTIRIKGVLWNYTSFMWETTKMNANKNENDIVYIFNPEFVSI